MLVAPSTVGSLSVGTLICSSGILGVSVVGRGLPSSFTMAISGPRTASVFRAPFFSRLDPLAMTAGGRGGGRSFRFRATDPRPLPSSVLLRLREGDLSLEWLRRGSSFADPSRVRSVLHAVNELGETPEGCVALMERCWSRITGDYHYFDELCPLFVARVHDLPIERSDRLEIYRQLACWGERPSLQGERVRRILAPAVLHALAQDSVGDAAQEGIFSQFAAFGAMREAVDAAAKIWGDRAPPVLERLLARDEVEELDRERLVRAAADRLGDKVLAMMIQGLHTSSPSGHVSHAAAKAIRDQQLNVPHEVFDRLFAVEGEGTNRRGIALIRISLGDEGATSFFRHRLGSNDARLRGAAVEALFERHRCNGHDLFSAALCEGDERVRLACLEGAVLRWGVVEARRILDDHLVGDDPASRHGAEEALARVLKVSPAGIAEVHREHEAELLREEEASRARDAQERAESERRAQRRLSLVLDRIGDRARHRIEFNRRRYYESWGPPTGTPPPSAIGRSDIDLGREWVLKVIREGGDGSHPSASDLLHVAERIARQHHIDVW